MMRPLTPANHKPQQISMRSSLARLYGRFGGLLWSQWALLAASAVAVVGAVAFRLAEPWPLKYIFDGLLVAETAMPAWLAALTPGERIATLVGAFIVIVLAHTGLTFISKLAVALAFRRILAHVRSEVFDRLQRMSILRHQHYGVGDLANRLTVDIDRLRLAGTNNAVNFVVNILTMAGMVVIMLLINWQLAVIAILAIPLFYVLSQHLTRAIGENARRFRASDGALSSSAVEALGAVRTVQGLSLHRPLGAAFDRVSDLNLALGMRSTILKSVLRQGITILFAVCIALVIWRGVLLVNAGRISPGDLIIFMAYLREGMEKPMVRFGNNLAEIARGAASGDRLLNCLDDADEPAEPPGVIGRPPSRGAIRFEGVSFRYPGGPLVLDDVHLTITAGERIAVVGPSGGGKSTLLGLVLRLYEPEAGSIIIDGVDARLYARAALRRSIATVFQSSVVFAMTVRENLTLGCPDATDAEVWEALELASAKSFVDALPLGLDTPLAGAGGSLSGGQLQRLGIARAALRRAPILLLDEPTSALDCDSRATVEAALRAMSSDATVLLVTHHTDGIEGFDRVLELRGGKLHDRAAPSRNVA